ncbi:hypothetical protein [Mucilaginibacter sp.]|uniref:hypothetical protein n=1 Tax=Mucilaginibacter sp. TaxID=1882438 RepID=UPI0035BC869E
MKEISQPIEIPITTTYNRKVFPISKRWKVVKNNSHPNRMKDVIATRIIQYELILGKVKELYKYSCELCYERDYKHDNENPFTVYSFLTSTFYWNIDCGLNFNITLEYQFWFCPFEQEIRDLFLHFNASIYVTEVSKQPTLPAFYKAVLAYQKPQYIKYL